MADPWWREDRGQFYIRVKDPISGAWKNRATGATSIREARDVQRAVEAELRRVDRAAPKVAPMERSPKLGELIDDWLTRRRDRGLRDVRNDESRLKHHVLPTLGEMAVAEIRPKHVVSLIEGLRQQQRLAPRSIRKTYGVLHKLFADLVVDEVVDRSPCVLTKDQLPKNVDKDREWRAGAVFTRHEAEILISSDAIAEDRLMFYALLLFTGARLGEAAALRWADYDDRAEPLHRITINRSFAGPLKTEVPRSVPAHPALAAMLAEWRLSGFARLMGRPPRPDDLIVPSRRGLMRTGNQVRGKFLDDLKRLGLRVRRVHDFRRTMITLCRVDGARKDVLEQITHGARGNILDAYTSLPWPTLCEAVATLRVGRVGAEVVQLRLVANAGQSSAAKVAAYGTPDGRDFAPGYAPGLVERTRFVRNSWKKHANSRLRRVEAAGIEPASEGARSEASTRVASLLLSSAEALGSELAADQPDL